MVRHGWMLDIVSMGQDLLIQSAADSASACRGYASAIGGAPAVSGELLNDLFRVSSLWDDEVDRAKVISSQSYQHCTIACRLHIISKSVPDMSSLRFPSSSCSCPTVICFKLYFILDIILN